MISPRSAPPPLVAGGDSSPAAMASTLPAPGSPAGADLFASGLLEAAARENAQAASDWLFAGQHGEALRCLRLAVAQLERAENLERHTITLSATENHQTP